jgi:hypothetical protein
MPSRARPRLRLSAYRLRRAQVNHPYRCIWRLISANEAIACLTTWPSWAGLLAGRRCRDSHRHNDAEHERGGARGHREGALAQRWGIVITSGAIPRDLKFELPTGARFLQKPCTAEKLIQGTEAVLPRLGAPVALKSLPSIQPGKPHGVGGIAHPLAEPDES